MQSRWRCGTTAPVYRPNSATSCLKRCPPRQTDREFDELTLSTVDLDRAAVLLGNDVPADRQAKTGALAGRLGREEGREQLAEAEVFRAMRKAGIDKAELVRRVGIGDGVRPLRHLAVPGQPARKVCGSKPVHAAPRPVSRKTGVAMRPAIKAYVFARIFVAEYRRKSLGKARCAFTKNMNAITCLYTSPDRDSE